MKEGVDNYICYNLIQKYGDVWITNFPKIILHISKYINDRQEILSTRYYGLKLLHTASDENRFYDAAGITLEDLTKIVNDSPNLNHSIQDQVNPFYNLLFAVATFYENKQKELEKYMAPDHKIEAAKFVRFYLTLRIYSISQRQVFMHSPKTSVMDYNLEHLNNRYIFSKINNIYEWLYDVSVNSLTNVVEGQTRKVKNGGVVTTKTLDLKNPSDKDIYRWVSNTIRIIKSTLEKLLEAETLNKITNPNGLVTEDIQATNKDTGKKFFVINANASNTIEIICNKVLSSFIQEPVIRENLLKVACKRASNISKTKVEIILNDIRRSNDNALLTEIIKDILSYWIISLNKESDTIHSVDFIKKCAIAYSISNTNDEFIIDLKNTLFTIIKKYASNYTATESKSTINSFKQAVFLYIVFYISSIK